ncbi:hypothetical protein G9A89_021661 [Geosiphon pyriformis]|nr:hypothetical protein G9A89_021661 [Geosiphon pyriformis]
MTVHTILLLQKTNNRNTRIWLEYKTVALAIEDIISMHETRLTEQNPNVGHINYSVDDLLAFMDGHQELSALVLEPSLKAYMPRDRTWLKERVVAHLRRQAQQASLSEGQNSRTAIWRGGRRR